MEEMCIMCEGLYEHENIFNLPLLLVYTQSSFYNFDHRSIFRDVLINSHFFFIFFCIFSYRGFTVAALYQQLHLHFLMLEELSVFHVLRKIFFW